MSKAIKSFEIIKEMYEHFVKTYRELEPKLMICEKEDFDNVETALKALEIITDIVQFSTKLPDIEINDDSLNFNLNISGAVGMRFQRAIENKERELLRNWILKECFPKELKALEIIKEKRVNVYLFYLVQKYPESTQLERYNDTAFAPKENHLTQEEYDLLKEVLL